MLFVVIYFSFLLTIFYTINLVDWDLIHTCSHFFILGDINFLQNQDFIGGFTKMFSTIYCSEVDPPLNKNFNTENSYLGKIFKTEISINPSSSKSLPAITINHNVPGLHSIGQGLTTVGEALINYAPIAMIGAAGMSTSIILKTIPPTNRAAITLATTGLMLGVPVVNQALKKFYQDSFETPNFINHSSTVKNDCSIPLGSETNNLNNIEEALTSSIIDTQFIYSSLETTNIENDISLAIFIFASSGLYALISLTISLLIREFSPENHPFVTARPRLLWYFKILANSSKISMAILILLIALAFGFILILVSYLRIYSFKGL